jgi:phage-related protein
MSSGSEGHKPIRWLAGAIKTPPFSSQARLEAGGLLRLLQAGELLSMPHSRPMPSIGPRCHELRIPDKTRTWRIIYRIDHDAIVIADVFAKAMQETPRRIIDVCRDRLRTHDMLVRAERRKEGSPGKKAPGNKRG